MQPLTHSPTPEGCRQGVKVETHGLRQRQFNRKAREDIIVIYM